VFTNDLLDHIGIVNDQHHAKALAASFDAERLLAAGGKIECTVSRAFVKPIGHRNTIHGWIVLIEHRPYDCVGKPWPVRS
jgi:hypothetical protein